MDKSDIQETLVSLYLRLNGYFVSGFIAHADNGVRTEMDVLAVRFPLHLEPEREVLPCDRLVVPTDRIDFVVGEVKGGPRNPRFNTAFWRNPDSIRAVLRRFGAFDDCEIDRVSAAVPGTLEPQGLRRRTRFPELEVTLAERAGAQKTKLRFVPFAAEQKRQRSETRPYVFEDDLFAFVWKCFRPEVRRPRCDVEYNDELWGPQFERMVEFFKNPAREEHGGIVDLYKWMDAVDGNEPGATPM